MDDHGDAIQRPHIGGEPVRRHVLQQRLLDRQQLLVGSPFPAGGPRGTLAARHAVVPVVPPWTRLLDGYSASDVHVSAGGMPGSGLPIRAIGIQKQTWPIAIVSVASALAS